MKSTKAGNFMGSICSMENLMNAWRMVKRKGGQPGGDEISIGAFERGLHGHLNRIARELQTDRYQPHTIRYYHMEKANGKTRLIGILSVQDRVAQRAFLNVLEPFYEKRFHPCSFGYRPGRGVDMALDAAVRLYDRGYPQCC